MAGVLAARGRGYLARTRIIVFLNKCLQRKSFSLRFKTLFITQSDSSLLLFTIYHKFSEIPVGMQMVNVFLVRPTGKFPATN